MIFREMKDFSNPSQHAEENINERVREKPEIYHVEWMPKTEYERIGVQIVEILRNAGAEAYFAGGYPRDVMIDTVQKEAQKEGKQIYPDFRFKPHDIDIATNLPYKKVKSLLTQTGFDKFKEVGANYTVLDVAVPGKDGAYMNYEVATYRLESDYGEDRKPKTVQYTRDIRQDAARRDFTMNGLYFDPISCEIIDCVDGVSAIRSKRLRAIGSPLERFNEDALRMLRFVRFRNKYGMNYGEGIPDVIKNSVHLLKNLPAMRLKGEKGEIDKILALPRAAFAINDMARLGILKTLLPEVHDTIPVDHYSKKLGKGMDENSQAREASAGPTVHKEGGVYRHTLQVLRAVSRPEFIALVQEKLNLEKDLTPEETLEIFYKKYGISVAWALLLHDVGKKQSQEVIEREGEQWYQFKGHENMSVQLAKTISAKDRLNFSNEEKDALLYLIENHMKAHKIASSEGDLLSDQKRNALFENKMAEALLFVSLADEMGNYTGKKNVQKKIEKFEESWQLLQEYRRYEAKIAPSLKAISPAKREVFFGGKEPATKKPMPALTPITKIAQRIVSEQVFDDPQKVAYLIEEIRDVLVKNGVDPLETPADDMRAFKDRVEQILCSYFNLNVEKDI